MKITNPREKGRICAWAVQGFMVITILVIVIMGDSSVITIDSSGSPGSYRIGLTEK